MSRITAPVAKLARSINSAATASRSSGLLESHYNVNQGAVLMPKYAELLKNRSEDSTRSLTTTHRPTPQPTRTSPAHRRMQTFSSSSPASASPALASMDFTVLPASFDAAPAANEFAGMRMPLLPDSFTTKHQSLYEQTLAEDLPLSKPEISVIAANPDNVTTAAALTEVEAFGVDGVELKWAHESEAAAEDAHQPGLRDLWKGLVDDVVGRKAAL
ncbi:hypothetical protein CGCF415_v012064 [Colletotrichum fructicola]|uniref:Uncharacterized protein n=5 Tax=Colletotrichum gloeosporioides species complex TaxID=2707338 RepID=A0A8H3WGI8_9PEZI|nr:uncharacterized protein CGMCC3_g4398 [Colletotrichum fructicola]KAF0325326.1 hypothetical protein GQ607_007360 [Colletotrichum asianum]KAF4487283.1 hypothetical protein CGGC5_v006647 [Colletotrichum fructicola Nara gc5]KAF4823357.1 hypothetical protein CGCSCA5_v001920 [Colletotrichum siamense]KAF4928343.1 hypothetical protein CGCVW01_v002008 [Colletotrichum viniferum]KAI8269964.1 hypothetical protein K4K58_012867 [Colletotrichum sp. SAR11_239]KAI8304941.1 hypothetical protein K4K61_005818 